LHRQVVHKIGRLQFFESGCNGWALVIQRLDCGD
jgi:hypothetical protein